MGEVKCDEKSRNNWKDLKFLSGFQYSGANYISETLCRWAGFYRKLERCGYQIPQFLKNALPFLKMTHKRQFFVIKPHRQHIFQNICEFIRIVSKSCEACA